MNKWVFAFAMLLVSPVNAVNAEEIVTPLGDRWYAVRDGMVTIPESGVIGPIIICLDDVPGGLDSTPIVNVKPLDRNKQSVLVRRIGFSPLPVVTSDGEPFMAYVSIVLEGIPGTQHIFTVIIRGKM